MKTKQKDDKFKAPLMQGPFEAFDGKMVTWISCILLDLPMYLHCPVNIAICPTKLVIDQVHEKNTFSWLLSLPYEITELIIRRIALPKFLKQSTQLTRHFTVPLAEGNLIQVKARREKGENLSIG